MIRRQMIAHRRASSQTEKQKASQTISKTLLARPECKKTTAICVYVSLPDEVDTTTLLRAFIHQKKTVVVPRVAGKELKLHRIRTLRDLRKGSFGIAEAKRSCPEVETSYVDLFIVPGVAFDRKGYRLGRGRGYYDRLLSHVQVPKIGLAYSFQIVPRLPHKEYDIPMDIVITEHETLTP